MQLVKVNKKEQAISQSADPDKKEKPVRIVKDVMQDSCNIKNVDKKLAKQHLQIRVPMPASIRNESHGT